LRQDHFNLKSKVMKLRNESRLDRVIAVLGSHTLPALLVFGLFLFFQLPFAFTQGTTTEIFQPKTKGRTTKEVQVYLPFHQKPKMVSIEFVDDMAVMEGDIVLGPSILYSGEVQTAIAIDGDSYRWKNGIIPYTIESGHPKRDLILQAIQHIHEQTSIRLIPRSGHDDYVTFVTGDGCWSRVGRCGGKQRINIGSCGFGSIVHEILHTAGLWHEQSRSDRDEHIQILWDNVKEDKKHNFKKHVSDGIDIGSYNCNSIMHYSSMAFSKNGEPTIISNTCSTLGQRSGMSEGDIAAINQLYKGSKPEGLTTNIWHLMARHSRKVIDIRGSGTASKVNVQQNQLNKSVAQKFRFIPAGEDYYYIQNTGSGLVLDVEGGIARAFTNVWQYKKNNTDAQKWRLIEAANGAYFIRSKLGDLNLSVAGASKDNGANIRVAAIKGGTNQQFLFQKAAIVTVSNHKYLKPLEHYWNDDRKDNFTTSSAAGKRNAVNGKYKFVRVDGFVLTTPKSSEGVTTPLYLYYNTSRTDNFTAASPTSIKVAEAGGYRRANLEGYVLKTVKPQYRNLYKPLWLYYHPARKDNFVTASSQGMQAAEAGGYRKVRIEGYVRKNNATNLAPSNQNQLKKN
jgi:hypothetical protein